MTCDRCQHWDNERAEKANVLFGICRLTVAITEKDKTRLPKGSKATATIITSALYLPDHITQLETSNDFGCIQFEAVSE